MAYPTQQKALALALFLLLPTLAQAYTEKQAVKAIIGEAENQGYLGMVYVGCAIRNRGTLNGVYGMNAPRVTAGKYTQHIYAQAKDAWQDSAHSSTCQDLQGAKHWENTNAFGLPYWAKGMRVVLVYKDHKFFK